MGGGFKVIIWSGQATKRGVHFHEGELIPLDNMYHVKAWFFFSVKFYICRRYRPS